MKKLIEKIGRISIRTYLIILLCIIFPLFLTFAFIRNQYEQYIQDQLSQQIVNSISRSEDAVYDSFRNMAGISSAIVTDNALLEALQQPGKTYYEVNKRFDESVNYTTINNLYAGDQLMLTLFDGQGRCYANWSQNFHDYGFLRELPWVAEAYRQKGHLVWDLFSPSFVLGENETYISAARAITYGSTGEVTGMLITSMRQRHLSSVLKEYRFEPNDSVYVFGDSDVPILSYAPAENIQPGELADVMKTVKSTNSGSTRMQTASGMKLVSYYTLDAPWTMGEQSLSIVHITDFQTVISRMNEFSRRMELIVLLALAAALIIAAVIVRMLVKPVRQLSHVMRSYRMQDAPLGLDMARKDEIGHLNRSFQRLTDHVRALFAGLDHEYRVKEQYRYESLRSQLNPHFLFNALNTIRYMAMMQHADSITEGVDALASVLKYSVGHEGQRSRLSEEIDHVKGYIAIQNMRFGQQVEVEVDFEPHVLSLCTPRFILQPIVENAVIHGFKEKGEAIERCLIRLYGHVEQACLHLYVEDNGNGIPPETAALLNSGTRSKMTGIGFSHVKELIEISFGKDYTVTVESSLNAGTVVHYVLPVLTSLEEEDGHEESTDR